MEGQLDPSYSYRVLNPDPVDSVVAVLVRTDVHLSPSALAGEVARAVAEVTSQLDLDQMANWRLSGTRVLVLRAGDEQDLSHAYFEAVLTRLPHWMSGLGNQYRHAPHGDRRTCLAVGPAPRHAMQGVIRGRTVL